MTQIIKVDPQPDFIMGEINRGSPRKYVRVIADNSLIYDEGKQRPVADIKPLIVISEDGRQFELDAVSKPENRASIKSGGAGLMYTCRIKQTMFYLFMEDNTWFIERV